MTDSKLKKHLIVVVDTGAIIRGIRLEQLGNELYTIPEVLQEVKDSKARHFLNSLPVPLLEREPSAEAIKKGTTSFFTKNKEKRIL